MLITNQVFRFLFIVSSSVSIRARHRDGLVYQSYNGLCRVTMQRLCCVTDATRVRDGGDSREHPDRKGVVRRHGQRRHGRG
jgi:hypothetical protein